MSEPMSKEQIEHVLGDIAYFEQSINTPPALLRNLGVFRALAEEVKRCHAEIERLEKALEGSESLRHTIMTSALDAKRTFTSRIEELEKIIHHK